MIAWRKLPAALLVIVLAAMIWPGCSCDDAPSANVTPAKPLVGVPGVELVSAGAVASSRSYRMVFTLGQPTPTQGKATSKNYRLQGGLIGANGNEQ